MSRKIVVIGGVAGGASVAARCRRLDEHAEIVVLERGPYPSYSNCCLPNYLSREVESAEALVLMTPETFASAHRIDVRVLHEATAIDPSAKTVRVKKKDTGESYDESYDELILATGAEAVMPSSIEGIDQAHVFKFKDIPDMAAVDRYLREAEAKKVAVVGGGFIGLEVMEHLRLVGYDLTLIEGQDQVMPPLDEDIAQSLHKIIYDQDVELILGDTVRAIGRNEVHLGSGRSVEAEAVIMAIGVRPSVKLATDCGIETGETGGIKVDHNYRTNLPHVYAIGDVIETHHFQTGLPSRLALAGPAQRQARACADAIYGRQSRNKGVVGASVLRLFDYNIASVGLNERECGKLGIEHQAAYVIPFDRVSIMPEASPLFFKLVFHGQSGKVLGAQSVSRGASNKSIDVVATAIQMDADLEDLLRLELAYAPAYNTPRDVVNVAAMVGLHLLDGEYEQLPMEKVRAEVERGACFIDVRPPAAFRMGHIKGAKNIPLAELRDRLDEIPRDETVYLNCRSSHLAYYALRTLIGHGYTNAKLVVGSMLGLSFYEYYRDQVTEREAILTGYTFR